MSQLTHVQKAGRYRFLADQYAGFARAYALLDGRQVEERRCIATAVRYTARAEHCERAELGRA